MTNSKAASVAATAIDLDRFNAEMGRRVRVRREMMQLSLTELSNNTGISSEMLSSFEAGTSMMPAAVVYSMTKALRVDLNFFWTEAGTPPSPSAPAGGPMLRLVVG